MNQPEPDRLITPERGKEIRRAAARHAGMMILVAVGEWDPLKYAPRDARDQAEAALLVEEVERIAHTIKALVRRDLPAVPHLRRVVQGEIGRDDARAQRHQPERLLQRHELPRSRRPAHSNRRIAHPWTGVDVTETHEAAPFFWSADTSHCPHEPEPDRYSDAWDKWMCNHQMSDDGPICLDAPAGDACIACSADSLDMVPWSLCRERDHRRPRQGTAPTPGIAHEKVDLLIGPLDCFERECDEYYDEDGENIPNLEHCSHLREEQGCSCQLQPDGEYGDKACSLASLTT